MPGPLAITPWADACRLGRRASIGMLLILSPGTALASPGEPSRSAAPAGKDGKDGKAGKAGKAVRLAGARLQAAPKDGEGANQEVTEDGDAPVDNPGTKGLRLLKAVLPGKVPEGAVAGYEPVDTRQPVSRSDLNFAPYSAIGQIRATYPGGLTLIGTGFQVAPGLIITAAHVLDHPDYGPAPSITYVPGCLAGGEHPLAAAQTIDRSAYRVTNRWARGSRAVAADFGVVALPMAQWQLQCGSLVLRPIEPDFFARNIDRRTSRFILAGYPSERIDQQWSGRGGFLRTKGNRLDHAIDTTGGQSGSPIVAVVADQQTGSKIPLVVAIHSRSSAGSVGYNQARKVDGELIVELRRMAAELQRSF